MGTTELVAAGTFLAIAAIVLGPYYLLVVRQEQTAKDVLRQRIRTGGSATVQAAGPGLLRDVERLSTIGPLNKALAGSNAVAANLRTVIQQSGLKVTPGRIVLGSACLAMLGYVVAVTWFHLPLVGVVAAIIMGALPYLVLRILRGRRLSKFEEQFPEAVDLIGRTLRAGHAFTTGLGMAADELPQPVASEFKLLYDQQNYGMPLPDALKDLARRIPLIDARFFVTAVLTQREAGGNLAEVLDNLSAVIRERFKIKRQIRVITAHGRLTGLVLALMPPALALYMMVMRPENFKVLLEDPQGIRMIIVAVCLQIVGAFMIYKISNVEY